MRACLGIIVHAGLLYFYSLIIQELTAILGVVVLLCILAWIGWTMATTPPPEPITKTPPPGMTGDGSSSGLAKPTQPAQTDAK